MSLPLFPCPQKFTFGATTLLPRGTFWVRVPRRPARGRPKAVFLLLACCTQEEDAGPAGEGARRPARRRPQAVFLLLACCTQEEDAGPAGQGPRRPARGRPKAVFLLLACCTQEEDAGPEWAGALKQRFLLRAAG